MKYNQQLNYQKRKRFILRVKILALLLIIPPIAVSVYLYFSAVNRQNSNTPQSTTSQETSGYFASTVQVFRSAYFQFQADKTWAEVPAESTPTKFVYRSLRATLVEHDLTIYVNDIPANLTANRVLPSNIKTGSELLPIAVSEHCLKAAKVSTAEDREIVVDNVRLRCNADSTNYTVLVGQSGGSTVLNLLRPDGKTAKYSILYSNLRATPDASQIMDIVSSFQTR